MYLAMHIPASMVHVAKCLVGFYCANKLMIMLCMNSIVAGHVDREINVEYSSK